MYEFTLVSALSLILLGGVAGMINTLAGGGSNLTLPALMMMGLPPDVANATNRVGIFFQSLTAVKGFKQHQKLDTPDLKKIVSLTLIGGVLGGLSASYLPSELLKPALLIAMITMAGIIVFKPAVVAPPEGTVPLAVSESSQSVPLLLMAGFYGGFVQAGVGFILIAAIAGSLRYDLVRTNALKVMCTLGFTSVALAIFIVNDQVLWLPGLVLAVGSMIGAYLAVNISINLSQTTLKWILFVMTIIASAAALLIG